MKAGKFLAFWLLELAESVVGAPSEPEQFEIQLSKPPTLMERVREWEARSPFVDVDTQRRSVGDEGLVFQVITTRMSDPASNWASTRSVLERLATDGETFRLVFVVRRVERQSGIRSGTSPPSPMLAFTISAYPIVQRTE